MLQHSHAMTAFPSGEQCIILSRSGVEAQKLLSFTIAASHRYIVHEVVEVVVDVDTMFSIGHFYQAITTAHCVTDVSLWFYDGASRV